MPNVPCTVWQFGNSSIFPGWGEKAVRKLTSSWFWPDFCRRRRVGLNFFLPPLPTSVTISLFSSSWTAWTCTSSQWCLESARTHFPNPLFPSLTSPYQRMNRFYIMHSHVVNEGPDENLDVLFAPVFFNFLIFHHPGVRGEVLLNALI